jgi:signal recognition particle receptor subunit beta
MEKLPPQMIVVGGPNGAGKTTFVRETQEKHGLLYLGLDQAKLESDFV